MDLDCPRSLPCSNQADYDDLSFSVTMTNERQDYVPSCKFAHYKWFRIKWLSFKPGAAVTNSNILFLSVNDMGQGKQDSYQETNASSTNQCSNYTFSMPCEPGQRVAYDSSADPYRWIPIPPGRNLRKFTFLAWISPFTAGTVLPPLIIDPATPLHFEVELRCSMPNFMS